MTFAPQTDFAGQSFKGATRRLQPQNNEQAQKYVPPPETSASEATGIKWEGKGDNKLKVMGPDFEDVAVFSSNISLKGPSAKSSRISLFLGIKVSEQKAQEEIEKYREIKGKSKSPNLILERFWALGKTSVQRVKLIAIGVSPQELAKIDAEVREQALAEIDDRIKEYLASNVTLKIFG